MQSDSLEVRAEHAYYAGEVFSVLLLLEQMGDAAQNRGDPWAAVLAYRRALDGESVGYRARFAGHAGDCFLEPLRDQDGRVTGVLGIAMPSDVKTHLSGPIEDSSDSTTNGGTRSR